MSQNKDIVLSILPVLSNADLVEIRTAVQALIGIPDTAQNLRYSSRAEMMCSALRFVFRRKVNGYNVPPFTVLQKKKTVCAAIVKSAEMVDFYLNEWFKSETIQTTQRIAMYRLFAGLTIDWLMRADIPPSVQSVCQNADKFAALIDVAFPGYVRSGNAKLILCRDAFGSIEL